MSWIWQIKDFTFCNSGTNSVINLITIIATWHNCPEPTSHSIYLKLATKKHGRLGTWERFIICRIIVAFVSCLIKSDWWDSNVAWVKSYFAASMLMSVFVGSSWLEELLTELICEIKDIKSLRGPPLLGHSQYSQWHQGMLLCFALPLIPELKAVPLSCQHDFTSFLLLLFFATPPLPAPVSS